MKNIFGNLMKTSVLVAGLFVLTGCGDDIEMPDFDGNGDVHIRVMPNPSDQSPLYAPVYYALGNYALTDAYCSGPGIYDEEDLEDYWAGPYYYREIPEYIEDFLPELPQLGEFTFTVIHENDTIRVKDELTDKVLDVLEITSFEKPEEDFNNMKVTWNKVEGVDGYKVKLVEELDGVPYFVSSTISKDTEEYEFSLRSPGWTSKAYDLEEGDNLFVVVSGFVTDERDIEGLQCETVNMESFTW